MHDNQPGTAYRHPSSFDNASAVQMAFARSAAAAGAGSIDAQPTVAEHVAELEGVVSRLVGQSYRIQSALVGIGPQGELTPRAQPEDQPQSLEARLRKLRTQVYEVAAAQEIALSTLGC